MLPSYADIRDKLGKPQWWDEHGVPRYCEFGPQHVGIYATQVVLLRIGCQACRQQFDVAMATSSMTLVFGGKPLSDRVKNRSIHYGDPPNEGCCAAGPTMNCEDLRVVQFWYKDDNFDWRRDPELEVTLPDGGGDEPD